MSKRKIKIAIFSGTIPSSTFVEHLINGIAKEHEVLLFGVVNKTTSYTNSNIKIYRTPSSHITNSIFTFYRSVKLLLIKPNTFFTIYKQAMSYPTVYEKWIWFSKFIPIALYKPDILHFQWARDLDFYAFFKTQLNMRIVVSLRGAHVNYTPIIEPRIASLYKQIFPKVDAFHAVSRAMSMEAQKYGAASDKIRVIHSPIQSQLLNRYTSFKKNNSSIFKILIVGRFHWIKGMKYTLDACKLLSDANFNFQLRIISTHGINEEALFQISQLGLKENVKIENQLDQNALFEVMMSSDALLLTSLAEGIANVVLEAMALGLPVVSTNCGGMSEVVKHKETGWLVPIRDSKAISEGIMDIANTSEQELQHITLNAHNLVKHEFNETSIIQQFKNIYQEVMDN